jgi:hypothetical protein
MVCIRHFKLFMISVISAPIAGTLMDNYGVVAGLYISTSMAAIG